MEKAYQKYGPHGTDQLRAFMIECQESTTNQIKGIQQPTKGDWTNLISFPVLHTHAPNTHEVVEAYHPVGIPFFWIICPDKRVRQMHNPDTIQIYNAMMDCPVGPHDSLYLTFTKIDSLKPYSCNDFIDPIVQIQNYGIDSIYSFRTKTFLNNVQIDSIVWIRNMKTFTVNLLNFHYSALANGSYVLKIITDRINGNPNIVKDSIIQRFTVAKSSQGLPLTENFSSSAFPYDKWTITKEKLVFPDWDWIDLNYAQSIYIPFYNIPYGYTNELILPRFDFTGVITPTLSFDYAYAKDPHMSVDDISISYKENCNDSWHIVRFMSIDSMSTAPDYEGFFIPLQSEWRTFKVSLNAVPRNPEVFIRIRGLSHTGGNFYLDNLIVKDEATAVNDFIYYSDEFIAYPNPANDFVRIKSSFNKAFEISITDLTGKIIKNIFSENNDDVKIDVRDMNNGVYLLILKNDQKITSRKLVIQH